MATEDLDVIRAALDEAASLDASRIELEEDDDGGVVLRGAVATAEQASAASLVVEEYADVVRNLLWVDHNLRETAGVDAPSEGDGTATAAAGSDDPERATERATGEMGGEIVTDVQESLDENVAWEPPDEPVMVPSAGEERGTLDHPSSVEEPAEAGPLSEEEADATAPSLPELSPEELARSAHPDHDQEEHH
jgi:hypothetical protein